VSSEPTDRTAGDYEALASRNAELEQELAKAATGKGWRMTVAFVLVILFAVALYAANHAVWFATTVLSTDQFVDTLAPLPEDPAVATALGSQFATSVVENNDVAGTIAGLLPDGIAFISAPITEAIEGVIADAATQIIGSDVFAQVWERSLRFTHGAVIVVLEGGPRGNLVATDGAVVLDLSGLAAEVDTRLTNLGIDIFDADQITAQIVIFDGSNLGFARWIAELIYTVRWTAPIAVLILLGAALLLATDRKRIGWWLGIATVITMALTLIELRFLRTTIVSSIVDPVRAEGVSAAWSIIVDRFVAQTWTVLALGLVAAVATWAFGASPRARAMRSAFDRSQPSGSETGFFGFVGSHARVVQWSAVVVGVAFLLMTPTLTGVLVILTAIIVGAVVAGAAWLAGSADVGTPGES
jgi:hypothetical protein